MATTTINTIEDLVRVLDENPEWLEALRMRLLTRELIELPRRFAEFAASVDQRFDEQGKVLDEHTETLAEHGKTLAEHGKTLDEHTVTLAEHGRTLDEHTVMLTEQGKVLAEHTVTLAEHTVMLTEQGKVLAEHGEMLVKHGEDIVEVKREVRLLRDDVGDLKGPRAEEETGKDIDFIAEQLGLTLTRVLTRDDLRALLPSKPLPGLPSKVRHSFTKADYVAEAVDESGETRYIAVEASYTVNGRDTDRAIRNAGILTQLTGKAARAVVAGYRIDDRQRPIIESGRVFWHELEP